MKIKKTTDVERLLAEAGLKLTAGRVALLKILRRARRPITQEQIAARLSSTGMNKVTIYRNMARFIKTGIVHKVFLHDKVWHFELGHNCGGNQCHPHFSCSGCDTTTCLTDTSLPLAKTPQGYTIKRQMVQLEGLCPKCQGR